MSPPRSPRRPNTIQALRDQEKEYRCRGCFSKCLPCVDTPATVIQKQLTKKRDDEFQLEQAKRNDPDRIQRDIILSTLSEFKQKLKILKQTPLDNPLDNEEQITLLNEKITQLQEELRLLENSMERKKLREELRQAASRDEAIAIQTLYGNMGGTINRKTRKYKKNNKKCKSKNRRSRYLKNIKRNRRTYKHRN
jgi:hypothetical protein